MPSLRHKEAKGGLLRSGHFIWFSLVGPLLAVGVNTQKEAPVINQVLTLLGKQMVVWLPGIVPAEAVN